MPLTSNRAREGGPQTQGARPRLDPKSYRTITREQWLLRETRLVAALLLDEGLSHDEVIERAQRENVFQYPTERMRANIAGVCLARIAALGEGEPAVQLARILAHGTDEQARQVNLYALMRSYRLVRECVLALVAPRLRAGERRLTRAELTAFLADLAQQSDVVAAWSPLTLDKCRQVLARCLAEAGLLAPERGSRGGAFGLRPLLLDPLVAAVVRAAGEGADPDLARAFIELGA